MTPLDPEDRETIRAGLWTIYATAATLRGALAEDAAATADLLLYEQSKRWPDLDDPDAHHARDAVVAEAERPRRVHEDGCVMAVDLPDHAGVCRDANGTDLTIPF